MNVSPQKNELIISSCKVLRFVQMDNIIDRDQLAGCPDELAW
jgi:hypothetical protein